MVEEMNRIADIVFVQCPEHEKYMFARLGVRVIRVMQQGNGRFWFTTKSLSFFAGSLYEGWSKLKVCIEQEDIARGFCEQELKRVTKKEFVARDERKWEFRKNTFSLSFTRWRQVCEFTCSFLLGEESVQIKGKGKTIYSAYNDLQKSLDEWRLFYAKTNRN